MFRLSSSSSRLFSPILRSKTFIKYSTISTLSFSISLSNSHIYCSNSFQSQNTSIPLRSSLPLSSPSLPLVVTSENSLQFLQRKFSEIWNFLKRFFYGSKRIIECSVVIGSAVAIAPPLLYFGKEEYLWKYIVDSIQYLGPTFIKLAQWASSRPDLFP